MGVPGRPRRWVGASGVLLYAATAAATAPMTSAAAIAVLVPCVVVLVLTVGRPTNSPQRRVAGGRLSWTALAWGGVVALAAALDMSAWLRQPAYNVASHEHPTLSLLLDPLTGSTVPRFLLWCMWLYAGYRLVRR
jgi:hypothetical protein